MPWRLFNHKKPDTEATQQWSPVVPTPSSDHMYVLPKGVQDEDLRLNFQHHLVSSLQGGLYRAPLSHPPHMVVDIGTGTGIWAKEMALKFPHAQVYGVDKDLPTTISMPPPPNYTFIKRNILSGFPFPDDSADFVYQRFMVLAIPAIQWPIILQELVRITKPGGMIELFEGGGAFINPGPSTLQLQQWWEKVGETTRIDVDMVGNLLPLLKQAGIVLMNKKTYSLQIGEDRLGNLLEKDILQALVGIKSLICTSAQIESKQFDTVVSSLPGEWHTNKTRYEYYDYIAQVS